MTNPKSPVHIKIPIYISKAHKSNIFTRDFHFRPQRKPGKRKHPTLATRCRTTPETSHNSRTSLRDAEASRPPFHNTATRGDHAHSPRLRFEELEKPSRRVAYQPPYVQTVSDSSSGKGDRNSTRAYPESSHQHTMEDDRMRITPSEIDEMDAQAIAAVAREYPHAPRPPRHRSTPTIGSNSYLTDTYMFDDNTRTQPSHHVNSGDYSSASCSDPRHRAPSNNHHISHPHFLPTKVRPPRTFTYDEDPIYRDDSLFSLPDIDEEDPYLRDPTGKPYYTYVPGTYQDIEPMQLPMTYSVPYSSDYHTSAPHRRSRNFLYEYRYCYNNFARVDPVREERMREEKYQWSNPSYDELPDIDDEVYRWSNPSHDELPDQDELPRYGMKPGRRGDSPLRRRRGNERLSTMYEDDATDAGGRTEIEVKTAGGTVVKVKRRRDEGYR